MGSILPPLFLLCVSVSDGLIPRSVIAGLKVICIGHLHTYGHIVLQRGRTGFLSHTPTGPEPAISSPTQTAGQF